MSRAATSTSWRSTAARPVSFLMSLLVPYMAPRPLTTARTNINNALPFIARSSPSHSQPMRPPPRLAGWYRSEEQPGVREVGNRADGNRDPVRQELHPGLALGGDRGELRRVTHRQDLVADRLELHPVLDHIARPGHHHDGHQTAHDGRGRECPERVHRADPGAHAGHQLDV